MFQGVIVARLFIACDVELLNNELLLNM